MLMQLSRSFLVATRLDAWETRPVSQGVSGPEHLKTGGGLTRPEAGPAGLPGRDGDPRLSSLQGSRV
jgi:hypothetical protein